MITSKLTSDYIRVKVSKLIRSARANKPFISHAQILEDVVLWRALKNVKNGFYVDIGANSPMRHTTTRAFYERGWRGVNVDPVEEWHKQHKRHRPRDTNIRVAISDTKDRRPFYVVPNSGCSSLIEKNAKNNDSGVRPRAHEITVETLTLSDLFSQYVQKATVHFLKIDVEGSEDRVLQGMNFAKYRPWIVLVESACSSPDNHNHHLWEQSLLDVDYHFAYADGLNRFYVAKEHSHLMKSLRYPPNVYDHYVSRAHYEREKKQHNVYFLAFGLFFIFHSFPKYIIAYWALVNAWQLRYKIGTTFGYLRAYLPLGATH